MKLAIVIHEDEVLAIFPEERADNSGHLTCYAHVGQHGAASPNCLRRREATVSEGASLLAELRSIYETGDSEHVPLELVSASEARKLAGVA